MNIDRFRVLAGDLEHYPEAPKAIHRLISSALISSGFNVNGLSLDEAKQHAAALVRDLLAELTDLEIQGLITAGDEHEFARWTLIADEEAKR